MKKNWPLILAQYKLYYMKVMRRGLRHYAHLVKVIPEECELNSYLVMIYTNTKDEIPGGTWKLRSIVSISKHSRASNQFILHLI